MTLNKNVQEHINDVANNPDPATSAVEALKIEGELIADLQAKMAKPKTEKATAQKAITDLQEANEQLQTAVPASTPGV